MLKTAVFGLLLAAMAVAEAADERAIKNLTGFVDANRAGVVAYPPGTWS